MTSFAAPHAEAVPRTVGPPPASQPPGLSPPHSSQPRTMPPSGVTTVANEPHSVVVSTVRHHTPLQPNRHHQLPDSSWDDHHTRLKGNQLSALRLPPRLSQPSVPLHVTKVDKTATSKSPSVHHSQTADHEHERSPHLRQPVPEASHSYHHAINVVSPHHHGSRLTAPNYHTSYMYPMQQLVTPVAHVPIGAAHYAHLPPSIWGPPHPHYHQHPHLQTHQLPPPHHVSPAVVPHPRSQVPYTASHLQHVAAPTHPPTHAYALHPSHTAVAPHAQPPAPPHAIHSAHHPAQRITYTYAQVQPPPPPHHAVKTNVAISPSQSVANGAPGSYGMPHSHPPRQVGCVAANSQMQYKKVPQLGHGSPTEQSPQRHSNGLPSAREVVKPYEMNGFSNNSAQRSNGTHGRTDSSPERLENSPLQPGNAQAYDKTPDQRKSESNQKDKDMFAPGQPIRKPRKPYTIKKLREVWTPEEHSRFLQALQLYDRDWKRIESFIGTKTVLQIRSHAQKHFGKVTKYKTGEYIPPPRPKKRAALPYPRSRTAGSKSVALNESTADNTTGSDSGVQTVQDVTARNHISPSKFPSDGGLGSPVPQRTTNGSQQSAPSGSDTHSKGPGNESPQTAERRVRSSSYNHNYTTSSHKRHDDNRGNDNERIRLPQIKSPKRWHLNSGSEEQVHTRSSTAPQGINGLSEHRTTVHGYPTESHVHQQRSPSHRENTDAEERQGKQDYRPSLIEPSVSFGSNPTSKHEERHNLRLMSSSQPAEHETSTTENLSRNRIPMPNNSLLVLSNCVDLMARDNMPKRQPAAGWATAAAARRAHRASVIRARKPPLPQPLPLMHVGDAANESKGNLPRSTRENGLLHDQSGRHPQDHGPVVKNGTSSLGGQSPPVHSPSDYSSDQPPRDPQRSSAGSGTGSDDVINGFSSSDRPTVVGSADGSGTGESLETSEAGDQEGDPKSSNDGCSGDDGNRGSPPTRDSSPGDPNSSGSRENSPTECPSSQPSHGCGSKQVAPSLQKQPEGNGVKMDRFGQVPNAAQVEVDGKILREGTALRASENGSYDRNMKQCNKVPRHEDSLRGHTLRQTMNREVHDDQVPFQGRSSQLNCGPQIQQDDAQKLSPASKKRQRTTMEYDLQGQVDGFVGKAAGGPESNRPRKKHMAQEGNYDGDHSYHGHDYAEWNR